jgi:glycosyltransferase involved in cell wall biosynthesis
VSSKKVRLFVEAHCFDNEFQGTRTFIRELYRALSLRTRGIDYYIAARDTEKLKKEFDFLPDATFINYRSGSTAVRLGVEIPNLLKKFNIDIAHFQYISPLRRHCDYIVTTHDILFNDFPREFSFLYRLSRNFLFKRSIARAAFKTTVSSYTAKRIQYHYGIKENKLVVVPNGVNERFFESYDRPGVRADLTSRFGITRFILFVSRIEPRKNNIILLKAFIEDRWYEKGYSLVFIGKTSIKDPELDEVIAQMDGIASSHFFHLEQVSDDDLLKFYQGAELFVYPSKAEGFGIPPLEAAALKVPVLCSNRTAMLDYTFFRNVFFDPDDLAQLKQKMKEILGQDNKDELHMISKEIEERYSWKNSADIFYHMLKRKYLHI